jgi:hypothetical protein
MDVSECLSRAVEVTNDFYVAAPGAAAIWDRLSRRRDFVKLRELSEVLNPQPAAQSVTGIGRVLLLLTAPQSDRNMNSQAELFPPPGSTIYWRGLIVSI